MILLNADLGESFGRWQSNTDADIMPFIDQANVACGYHAGDPKVLVETLQLVKLHQVQLGAHPSYPDLQGFGRRSMRMPADELIPLIQAQLAVVEGMARCQGLNLAYVKPHGALYNDMMQHSQVFEDVVRALAEYHSHYPLMIQALASNAFHMDMAAKYGIDLIFEAFADRRYKDTGYLKPRNESGAVLSEKEALEQVKLLLSESALMSESGEKIHIKADTICVHGDTPSALAMLAKIREMLA